MSILEIIRFALRGLTTNKLRTTLTTLGIAIGVSSVIILIAVGNGSSKQVQSSIDKLGTNTITIQQSFGGFGLFELSEAAELVEKLAHPDANIIFGTVIDDALGDEIRITVIAAGFDGGAPKKVDMPTISTTALSGNADPIPANDPIAVANESAYSQETEDTDSIPVIEPQTRKVIFETHVDEDEVIDIPDFMK